MMLAAAWTALLLLPPGVAPLTLTLVASHQAADAPAKESRTPAVVGAKDERAAQASEYYSKGRYVEASLEFEGLWRDFPGEPRFLFNAAASRYIAGHYAHTIAYLDEYLARKDVQGADRQEAQAQRDEARNKVAAVQVGVTLPPGAPGDVTVVVQHVARGASDLRPELLFPARAQAGRAGVVVQLEPGTWIVRAKSPGHDDAEQRVEITRDAGQKVALTLKVAAVAPPTEPVTGPATTDRSVPPEVARRAKIGVAAVGGVAAVAGIAVLAVGAKQRGGLATCDRPDDNFLACKQDLAAGLRMRDAGAAVLGGGIGLLAGGLTWISRDAATRRKAWIAEAAVGGLALVGGAAWLSVSSLNFNKANTGAVTSWPDHYAASNAGGHAAAAAVFGLGAGLVGGAITGLIIQRRHIGSKRHALRNLRIDGAASPRLTGLVLSGRF